MPAIFILAIGTQTNIGADSKEFKSPSLAEKTLVSPNFKHGSADTPKNQNPTNALQNKALIEKAEFYNKIVESEEALQLCNRVIAQDKSYAPAYLARADAYSALDRIPDALSDLAEAAKSSNSGYRLQALRVRAHLYYALKRYPEALQDMKDLINKNNQHTDGLFTLRARVYAAMHKPDLAAEDLTSALKLKPRDTNLLSDRAEYYLAARELDKALIDLNHLIKVDEIGGVESANAQLYSDRAQVYELMGRKDLAAADRKVFLEKQKANFDNAPFASNPHHR